MFGLPWVWQETFRGWGKAGLGKGRKYHSIDSPMVIHEQHHRHDGFWDCQICQETSEEWGKSQVRKGGNSTILILQWIRCWACLVFCQETGRMEEGLIWKVKEVAKQGKGSAITTSSDCFRV